MTQFQFEHFLMQDGRLSLGKAALMLAMVANDLDDAIVAWLREHHVKSVITRAGGSGDNLKAKLLRNTFGAAEKSGLLRITPRNRYAIAKLVEEVIRSFDSPILEVAGGGLKIGLAIHKNDLSMGVCGNLGIPGMDVDYEVSVSRTLYHYLEE
ncbi:MAG: HutP [Candidatus Riflebacteria bacterium]|nr:HutP [Candidatus Riflebacteria bacterium]